jgi:DNA anti-recombination protein RmuC
VRPARALRRGHRRTPFLELLSSAETRLATQQEIDRRFDEVDRRLAELREEVDRRFEQMEARFDRKLETTAADLERRLTVRIVTASDALAAFIAVLNCVMG